MNLMKRFHLSNAQDTNESCERFKCRVVAQMFLSNTKTIIGVQYKHITYIDGK